MDRPTLADLCRLLLSDYRLQRRRSADRAEYGLAHVRLHFGDEMPADLIAYDGLTEYATARMTGEHAAAPATVRQELALLRRAYVLGSRSGKVAVPVFPTIRVDNARRGFVDRASFECLRTKILPPLRPLVTFLYVTGWRRSEALSLTWRQVDFELGVVRLEPGSTKNGDGREFPFAAFPELARTLSDQRDATHALELELGRVIPLVFHRRGKSIRDYRDAWREACKACGLGGNVPHDFRRSAVRNLERAGVSRSTAMALSGHRTEEVYRRYAITARSDLEEGVRKLARLFTTEESGAQRVLSLDRVRRR